MRIRRYAARLLSSSSSAPPPPPPPAAAASWFHAAADDCAICELNRSTPQVAPDSIKQKGHIASRAPEAELRSDERAGLAQQPPVPEAQECKIEVEPPGNEAATKPEVTEEASLVNEAATEPEFTVVASLVNKAAVEPEVTAGASLVNEAAVRMEVTRETSLVNEAAVEPGVTGGASLVNEAAVELEVTGRASAGGHDAAVLDEPGTADCDSEVDNVRAGNAGEVGASMAQPFQDDARYADISVDSMSNSTAGAKGSSIDEGAPRDTCIDTLSISCVSDIVARSVGRSGRTDIICYARRKGQRKLDMELKTEDCEMGGGNIHDQCEEKEPLDRTGPSNTFDGFVHGPCESMASTAGSAEVKIEAMETELVDNSAASKDEKMIEQFECDIDYCRMTFKTRADLSVHKKNMCTVKSCSKHFRSHRYLRHHQCVHSDERPFKCPWEGCTMAFKWSWARAEHFQVHTGEKPYKCMTPGCGKRYKYVSDFSRHRRRCKHQR